METVSDELTSPLATLPEVCEPASNLLVCIPSYSGKVSMETFASLFNSRGFPGHLSCLCIGRDAYLDSVRNRLVTAFLEHEEFSDLFKTHIVDGGKFVGEDVAFSATWRHLGGKIWVLPNLNFQHVGLKTHEGNFSNYLMRVCDGRHEEDGKFRGEVEQDGARGQSRAA
jgi:hypothetical protein